jgi:hypothetical protein
MTDRDSVLAPLDGNSALLFLVAGGLLVVFAANTGARTFTAMGSPAVQSIVGPAGFFVGLVGLIGLYSGLAGRTLWAARVAAVVAAIPLVGWFVITVWGLGSSAGILPGLSVVFPGAVVIVVFLTTILAYVGFGMASLRARVHSRTIGLVLLMPAVPFLMLIVAVQVLGPVEWAEFVIDSGHALAHLAVGIALRSAGVPTDRTEPAADATP